MPHIIVEYPEQLVNYTRVGEMLQTIHDAIAHSGLFKADQIRTRVATGMYQAGATLPPLKRLRLEFGAGSVTVRRALDTLVADVLSRRNPSDHR